MLCGYYASAQTVAGTVMGLDQLFRMADENSRSLQAYRTGREAAAEALKAARRQQLPEIRATLSLSYLGDGKLWNRDFSQATSISMPHFGNNFALEAEQVVYAGGAVRGGIALAELGNRSALLDWQKNRQEIRFLLVGYYLDLYKLRNQAQVLQRNLDLAEQVIRHMEVRREQGTALKNDITRYELQRERLELQLARVEDARKIRNHQLVTTLHLPAEQVILPDTTLLATEVQAFSEKEWQTLASGSNLDLQQAQLAVRMGDERIRIERAERLPKIALVAAEHLDGPITIEVPVLDNNFNYWFVGIGVKYNLSSLFKNDRKLKQARLEKRRSMEEHALAEEQVGNAVQAGYVNFMTAFADLRTQEKSVELADENYAVTSNRYRNELALLTDMIDAGNMKLEADLGLVDARINLLYNYYKMKYITHTL